MFFKNVRVRGLQGSVLWGYRTAAELAGWTILRRWKKDSKKPDGWRLVATVRRGDSFQLRQKPLMFTAPRDKGFWSWPIQSLVVTSNRIEAVLGEPEQ